VSSSLNWVLKLLCCWCSAWSNNRSPNMKESNLCIAYVLHCWQLPRWMISPWSLLNTHLGQVSSSIWWSWRSLTLSISSNHNLWPVNESLWWYIAVPLQSLPLSPSWWPMGHHGGLDHPLGDPGCLTVAICHAFHSTTWWTKLKSYFKLRWLENLSVMWFLVTPEVMAMWLSHNWFLSYHHLTMCGVPQHYVSGHWDPQGLITSVMQTLVFITDGLINNEAHHLDLCGKPFQWPIPSSLRYWSSAWSSLQCMRGSQVVSPRFHWTWKDNRLPSHLWAVISSTYHSVSSRAPKSYDSTDVLLETGHHHWDYVAIAGSHEILGELTDWWVLGAAPT
jgi:hypothetical protein